MFNEKPILSFEDVNFAYAKTPIISNLSFTLFKNNHLCIKGRNGCGKTTISKLALGLLVPDRGDVFVLGHNTRDEQETPWRKSISALFQNPENQIINLSVIDDVIFTLKNLRFNKEESLIKAKEALHLCGVSSLENRLVYELSGGEIQMVALAGAIVSDPKLLVLDEPTSYLDQQQKNKLKSLIEYLKDKGVSILSISHDDEYLKIADEVLEVQ